MEGGGLIVAGGGSDSIEGRGSLYGETSKTVKSVQSYSMLGILAIHPLTPANGEVFNLVSK